MIVTGLELLTILIWFIFGVLSIATTPSAETLAKWKKNILLKWTLAKNYELAFKVNKVIGSSVGAKSFFGTLRFVLGLVYLFIYYFLINLLINVVKLLIFQITGMFPPSMKEGFGLFLGAGLVAYWMWTKSFAEDTANVRASWSSGQRGSAVKQSVNIWARKLAILVSGVVYIFGLAVFLNWSPSLEADQQWMLGGVVILFVVIWLIDALLSVKALARGAKPVDGDQ
jgi:hypothetical protein